jgi:hypothetical protein
MQPTKMENNNNNYYYYYYTTLKLDEKNSKTLHEGCFRHGCISFPSFVKMMWYLEYMCIRMISKF